MTKGIGRENQGVGSRGSVGAGWLDTAREMLRG